MDISDEYIKMCEKAEEVQKEWKPTNNDYQHRIPNKITKEDYNNHKINLTKKYHIWLPRQDQIQEMMNFKTYQVGWFSGWVHDLDYNNKEKWQQFDTMEKLWLAFYMEEKYGKVWNGDEWFK
jgi:hypothetical protein